MKMNRRQALTGLLAAGGGLALSNAPAWGQALVRYPLGLQFFTLTGRERPLTWEEFSGKMADARAIGYNSLEMAGLSGHDPELIRRRAQELGFKIPSMHMGFDQMLAFMGKVQNVREAQDGAYTPLGIEQITRINLPIAQTLGCEWGVIAASGVSNFKTVDTIKVLCDSFNKSAALGKQAGIKVAYHMHATDFEPVQGQMPFKIMLDNTGPDMFYQLDVCWASAAGVSPADLIRRYSSRIVSFHLKDLTADKQSATPGDGVVDFAAIHAAVAAVKNPLFFVERDQLAGKDPLVEATRSYKYLQKLGWGN